MRMTVTQRLLSLMLQSENLDSRVQWRIFQEGSQERNVDLLVQLLNHPALDPAVDAALGESSVAAVRAAWLTRPGRSLRGVTDLVRDETRVTVLAAILEFPGVPEEVVETAAERLSALKVLPFLARTDFSMGLREKLAVLFAEKVSARTRLTASQLAVLPPDPTLMRLVFQNTVHCGLAAHCLTLIDADAQDLDRIVDLVVAGLDPQHQEDVRPLGEWLPSVIASLNGHCLTADHRSALEAALAGSAYRHWERDRLVQDLRRMTSSNVSREQYLAALHSSSTVEEVESVMRTVALHRLPILPFAKAAYTLPQISSEAFRVVLSSSQLSWRDVRILWDCKSDPVRTAMLYVESPWLDFTNIEVSGSGAAVVKEIVRECTRRSLALPQDVQQSRHLTGDLLMDLPVGVLLLLTDAAAGKLSDSVSQRLVDAVSDEGQWAVLRVLANEFEGTLPELLDTSHAL